MGVVRQFGALLWKNYIARRRHPLLFLLEILLPVIIFVAVGLMRRALPPSERTSCSYKERSLPSAGLVPFLQSSVCALDNPCVNESARPEIASRQQQFRSLIADLGPTLEKPTTMEAMRSLPTVSKVFKVLKDSKDKVNLTKLDDMFLLKNMVKDPAVVHHILVEKYRVLTSEAAYALLDSSLNAMELMGISAIDWKGIVCDPKLFQKYVYFKKEVDVESVSQSLCDISDDTISSVVNELVKQLDIKNIIDIAGEFAGMTGEIDMSLLLSDLGGLLEMFLGSSSLAQTLEGLSEVKDLPKLFMKMTELLPVMQGMADLDWEILSAMYEIAKPMLSSLNISPEVLDIMDSVFANNNNMTEMLKDPGNLDWQAMLAQFGPVTEGLGQLPNLTSLAVPSEEIGAIISGLIANGSFDDDAAINRTLVYVEQMMTDMMGSAMMNTVMYMAGSTVDMVEDVQLMSAELLNQAVYQVQNNAEISVAISKVSELEPSMASDFLKEAVKTQNIYGMLTHELNASTLCHSTAYTTLGDLTETEMMGFTSVVCQPGVTDAVDAMFNMDDSYTVLQDKMVDMMDEMELMLRTGDVPLVNVTMTDMYYRMMDTIGSMDVDPFISEDMWKVLLTGGDVTDQSEWIIVWSAVSQQYGMNTNLFLLAPMIGESMEKSSMWNMTQVPMTMVYAILDVLMDRADALEEMSKKDTVMAEMVYYLQYVPEVTNSFLKRVNKGQLVLSGMGTSTANILEVLCDEMDWAQLNLSYSVPVEEMKAFLCTTDWMAFFQEFIGLMEPMTIAQEVEEVYMDSQDTGIDWMNAASHIERLKDMFLGSNLNDLWSSLNLDMDMMWTVFTTMQEFMSSMTMESIAGDNLRINTAMLVTLDQALTDVSLWTRVKHYFQLWLYWAKSVEEYEEATLVPGFNRTDYVNKQSPSFAAVYTKVAELFPTAKDFLKVENFGVVMDLLSANSTAVCVDIGDDTKQTSNAAKLIDIVCRTDWTLIMKELENSDGHLGLYMSEFEVIMMDTDSLPPVAINWTDLFLTTDKIVSQPTDKMLEYLFFGLWEGDDIMAQLEMIMTELNQTDFTSMLSNTDALSYALISGGASTPSLFQDYMRTELFLQYHVLQFMIRQLEYFNGTDVVDLKAYMNSAEVHKLLDNFAKSPELAPVVFETMKAALYDNKFLSVPLEEICNKSSPTFSAIIKLPSNATMTVEEIQELVCSVDVDFETMIQELRDGMVGLDELITAIEIFESYNSTSHDVNVTYADYKAANDYFTELMSAVLESPPSFVISGTPVENYVERLVSEIESQLTRLDTEMNWIDYLLTMAAGMSQQSLQTGLAGIPEMKTVWTVASLYMDTLQSIINLGKVLMLEPGTRSGNYPEMQKVWELMDWFPEIFLTYTYTSVTDEAKVTYFTALLVNGTDIFCMANPADLMTVPPDSDFNFASVFIKFCSIEMAALAQEMEGISDLQAISDAYNSNFTMDTSNLQSDIDTLVQSATEFFNSSNSWYLPRFLNETLWTKTMESVLQLYMPEADMTGNMTNATMSAEQSVGQALGQFQQQLIAMQSTTPELGAILQMADMYMRTMERMVAILQGTFMEDDTILDKYPNMKTTWSLMQHLPAVVKTMLYTAIVDSNKILATVDSLMKGTDYLCAQHPEDLMTDVPGSDFSFANFLEEFCSINFTTLMEESLRLNADDLEDLFMPLNLANATVNITDMFVDAEDLMASVTDIFGKMASELQLPGFLNESAWAGVLDLPTGLDPANLVKMAAGMSQQSLQTGLAGIPEMKTVWTVASLYMDTLQSIINMGQVLMMEPGTMSGSYAEMQKVRELIDWFPEIFLTYTYTSVKDEAKVTFFTALLVNGTEALCMANPADLMTVLPDSDFSFAMVFIKFCSIDMAALAREMEGISDMQAISDAYNSNFTVDTSNLQSDIDALVQSATELFNSSNSWYLPRLFNETLWTKTMESLLQLYMPEADMTGNITNATMSAEQSVGQALAQFQQQLIAMQSTSPELGAILQMADMYMRTMERMVAILQGTFLEDDTILDKYPNMKTTWSLMQHLPAVVKTMMYTAIVDSNKILATVDSLMNGTDHLCAQNPEDLMTDVPGSGFSFAGFFIEFCSLDFTALMEESLRLSTEDLEDLFMPLNLANATVNVTDMFVDAEDLMASVTNIFSKMATGLQLPGFLNESAWAGVLDLPMGLDSASLVKLPSNVAMLEGIVGNDTIRILATMNLFLEEIVKEAKANASTLSVPQIIKMLESLQNVTKVLEESLSSSAIDSQKLKDLLADPERVAALCDDGTLAEFVTIPGGDLKMGAALQGVMCLSPEALVRGHDTQQKLMAIWSGTADAEWYSLQRNLEKLGTLVTQLVDTNVSNSTDIVEWLDANLFMGFLQSTLTDPEIIFSLLRVYDIDLGMEGNNALSIASRFMSHLVQRLKAISDDESLSDPVKYLKMMNLVSSTDEWMSMLSEAQFRYVMVVAAEEPLVHQFTCSRDSIAYMNAMYGPLSRPSGEVSSLLCGLNGTDWYDTLVKNNFTYDDMMILMNMIEGYSGMTFYGPDSWQEILDRMSEVTRTISNLDFENFLSGLTAEDLLNRGLESSTISTQQSIELLLGMLDGAGDTSQMVHIMEIVSEYLAMLEPQLKGEGDLSKALPNIEKITEMLETILGEKNLASVMLAVVNPEQMFSVWLDGSWTSVMCDLDLFMATFTFPEGTDVAAIQRDLCKSADKIPTLSDMSSDEAAELWSKLEEVMGSLNGSSTSNHTMGSIMQQISEQITRMIENTEASESRLDHLANWLIPLITYLQNSTSQLIQSDGLMAGCDGLLGYIKNTEFYRESLQPVFDSYLLEMQVATDMVQVMLDVHSVACGADREMVEILRELQYSSVPSKLTSLAELITGSRTTDFSCSAMAEAYDTYMSLSDAMTQLFNESVLTCITDLLMKSGAVFEEASKLQALSDQLTQILQDDQMKDFLEVVGGSPDIAQMFQEFVSMYIQQQQAQLDLERLLTQNMTNLMEVLTNTFDLASDQLTTFIKGAVGLQLDNMTAEMLIDKVCTEGELDPQNGEDSVFGDTLTEVRDALCGDDRAAATEAANYLLELSRVVDGLQDIETGDLLGSLSQDISNLLKDIEGVSDLALYVEKLGSLDLENINGSTLAGIQRLLLDQGPDRLLESLNKVLDNFATDEESSNFVADAKMLAKGLFAFKSLRQIFMTNVQIQDLVHDTEELTSYLINTLDLPEEVATAVVEGSLSFEMLLQASQTDIAAWVCDPDQLAKLLKDEEKAGLDVEYVSTQFCSLNTSTVAAILEEILDQLDVGDVLEEMIVNGIGSMLRDANTTLEATKTALADIQVASDDLTQVLQQVERYMENVPNAVEALTDQKTGILNYRALSEMICGDPIAEIADQTGVGSIGVKRPELTEGQRQEMRELPGKQCQNLYADIMAVDVGPFIWGYLKPLLRGKILYAPDTAMVRSILAEVNTTFESLERVLTLSSDWASGVISLKDLLANNGTAEIQEMFNNTMVKSILSSLTGTSPDSLEDMVYTLNEMDDGVVSGLGNVARWAADYLQCVELSRFQGFATEEELAEEAMRLHGTSSLLAGIVFTNVPSGREKRQASANLPPHVGYKIRMNIDSVTQTRMIKERMWRPQPEDQFSTELRYFRGFIQLQDMVDSAIIALQAGSGVTAPSVTTQQFPFPCYVYDVFVNTFAGYGLPIVMTLSWIIIISVAVNFLVYDRESGQEENLKAMGMTGPLNWWAWFLTSMVIMAAMDLVVTAILMGMQVFNYSSFAVVYLYILDFLFSTLMLSYFVSAFFTRPAMAILASLIVYILSYLPYVILMTMETEMTFWQKSLACLSSTTAFSFSAIFIARYEETQIGVQWDNIDTSPIHGEDFTFSWGCIMMLIDAAIYLVLGYYVRNVKPGKYGLSQPWYFLVCPSYWCGVGKSKQSKYQPQQQDAFVEETTGNAAVVMSVRGLVKEFKAGKRVVDNLNLDIHGSSVTTLLGHNGAAKTTTMKMLIGQLEPTSGEITVFGSSVSKMRESIGICPQHNSLYEYMTVEEHMQFYSSMKSNPKVLSDKQEIEKLLTDVGLWHSRHQRVTELSGGMKRRLCVALAFVGGSKLVILDEPTSGVDPSGRRAIWNLILKQKYDEARKDVAVLLSTHHLDEADMISDQVVILHEGRVLAQGSPIFLKQSFSTGHRLTVTVDPSVDPDPAKILERLRGWVPEVRIQHVFGHETQYVLPPLRIGLFYSLFTDLEEHKQDLGILSYGVSDPTLEEVFMKVCSAADSGVTKVTPDTVKDSQAEQTTDRNGFDKEKGKPEGSNSSLNSYKRIETVTGASLFFAQLGALLTKRFHHFRRDYRMLIVILLLPLLLFLAASGFYSIKPDDTKTPSLVLTPALYGPDTHVFFKMETGKTMPYGIVDTFMHNPGIGTTCMQGMDFGDHFECVTPDSEFTEESLEKINATCRCDNSHKFVCDKEPAVNHPRHMVTTTTDILQELGGKDVADYLLQSFHSYTEKRYGGLVFSNNDDPSGSSDVEASIWYNNKGHHALPSFYNAYSNGFLRSVVSGNPSEYGITTYNHPFLFDKEQISEATMLQSFADLGIAFCIVVAFTFIPAGALIYVVMETVSRDKQLQGISGVGTTLYWFCSLVWDMLLYGVGVAMAVVIMAIFKHDAFWERENLEGIVVLLFLFGWACLCLMYCASRCFKDVATAFFVMFCSLVILGLTLSIIMLTMEYFVKDSESLEHSNKVLNGVFMVIPTYALGSGLIKMITNQVRTEIFARFNTDVYVSPFSLDLIGWNLVAMAIEGFVFFILTILLDMRCRRSRRYRFENPFSEEEDVAKETRRVEQGHSVDDVVLVQNLHKVYKSSGSDVHAVNGLSFGVQVGECFGLLGVNGAGKTTTFNILTGVLDSTEGDAIIMGRRKRFGLSQLGYCPQDDALDPYLTIVETLFFHSKLKGIASDKRNMAVKSVMERLELLNIQKKLVKNCSGGMKRKLCLAIALLGDPEVVLLDEPTTGMDPKAKRLVWNYLLSAKEQGMSIILTSHSMEECDIMCDRIGIMVNGRFKCLGSSQHLKEKYGNGYTIKLSFSGLSTTSNMIQELIDNFFPSARIREYHQSVLQLDVPRETYRLTDLLHILEQEKDKYNIVYYTVAQTTLDTVFLNFAREQTDSLPEESSSESAFSLRQTSTQELEPKSLENGDQHMYDNKLMAAGYNPKIDSKLNSPFAHPVTTPDEIYTQVEDKHNSRFGESTRL